MITKVAKCGCDCSVCLTYKENIRTQEDRSICSAGWEKYLNIKLSPEKLRACDGCSVPDQERKTYYLNCKIRKCAMINGIENCAFCTGFPCDELIKVHNLQKISSREEYIEQKGKEISATGYKLFVEPYTGLSRLNDIRKTLTEKDYKVYKRYSPRTRYAPLTNDLKLRESLKIIYFLLTTIGIEKNVSYARLQTLARKREQLLKILWTMGLYGAHNTSDSYLELDGKTFLSQKVPGMYPTLLDYFNDLKMMDIHGEIVPLKDKGWLTPMGGLRKEGWVIRLTFGKSLNGNKTLAEFRNYICRLDEKYKNKAYGIFKIADLDILRD